jgi:rRNA maturation endonuclease Nob1
MRQIKYFCDICGKEAKNPKEEMSCIKLDLNYVHDWETALPLSRKLQDKQLCKDCGEKLNTIINKAIERKGFEE